MSRWALRILPSWPWSVGKPGDLVGDGWMDTDRDALERVRLESPNAAHYAVVELDDTGDVIHRTVTSQQGVGFLACCIDCGATAHNKQPTGPCAGVTT